MNYHSSIMMRVVGTAVMAVSLVSLTACISSNQQPNTFKGSPEWVSDINIEKINEPSGIVYHPDRGSLFVVGDEGVLAEITEDGKILQKRNFIKDLEGITVNPSTGYLYLAIEGDEIILEIEPDSLSTLRQFQINRTFQGEIVLPQDGSGIEAITYLPSNEGETADRLLLSNQYPPLLFEVHLPPPSESITPALLEVSIQRIFQTEGQSISGLYFDEFNGIVFAISDQQDALYMVSTEGDFLDEIQLHGREQEGITFDQLGHLYIAQDSGQIFKYTWSN